jgi:MFS superfamily sulfate permease-like transporter
VVALGVEYGIVLAVVASVVDHLRHSYSPLNSVLVKSPTGHWRTVPITPGARTEDGIVVYRFGTSLYYANAARLLEDVSSLVDHGAPLRWLVVDCAAIGADAYYDTPGQAFEAFRAAGAPGGSQPLASRSRMPRMY